MADRTVGNFFPPAPSAGFAGARCGGIGCRIIRSKCADQAGAGATPVAPRATAIDADAALGAARTAHAPKKIRSRSMLR